MQFHEKIYIYVQRKRYDASRGKPTNTIIVLPWSVDRGSPLPCLSAVQSLDHGKIRTQPLNEDKIMAKINFQIFNFLLFPSQSLLGVLE